MQTAKNITEHKYFLPIAAAAATAVLVGISIRIWNKWSSSTSSTTKNQESDTSDSDSDSDGEGGGELLTFEEFILSENDRADKEDSTEISFKEFMEQEKQREILQKRIRRLSAVNNDRQD